MTRKIRRTWHRKTAALAATMMAMSFGGLAYAMPQGETIRSGHGEITRQDKEMTVNQDTKHLAIDWKGFDINNDERVRFNQPDAASIALNRVTGDAKTFIDGSLTANGQVFVINPNGVLFGQNASVDVGSLVASTARVSDSQMEAFGNGDGTLNLALADDSTAKVINEGTIRAEGGLVVLHAAAVENSGMIENEGGKIALAAAKNINLSADTAGKLNFTVDGTLAKASTLNSGVLKADGGYIVMTAKQAGDVMSTVVNNTGTIEAKTLRQNEKGEILLDGGESGIVEINGTLDASGMEAGQSAGQIKAIGAETHVKDGAALLARGTVDGGLIETSGDYLEIGDTVNIDAAGETGKAGEWLLDPLDVVISSENPGNATEASGGPAYSLGNVTNASKTSWVDSDTINWLLSNGTSVRVESADINKAASISVNSAIVKTGEKEASFTLEAQRNITINKDITARDGKLNVTLNSDTDGDAIGAVIINADITTNGGNFTSGSGGTRHYNNNSLVGAGDPSKGTVGTYFGNGGTTGNRSVTTNGGAVNLYGDVAIGLNGGKLTIDTTKSEGKGGVNITGTIESGNSYTLYYQGKAGWDDLVKKYAMEHGFETTATKYTGTKAKKIKWGDTYYTISEDGLSIEHHYADWWSPDIGKTRYTSYDTSQVTITRTYTADEYNRLSATDKADMSHSIANSWEAAKWLAQNGTGGGSAVNDTYLATITSSLENSLAAPTGEIPLFVGGKGSGSSVNPADPEHSEGYYWVTGPEGEVPGGKGTKFADNSGTPLQNYYAKWHKGDSETSHSTTTEPNNSGPYVTVGYGVTSNWDDVATSAGTTKGFVQEKNLAHSGLEVQAGSGKVDLKGNAGLSVGLKNLTINTTGNVTVGGGRSAAGTTYTGQIRTDEGVSIHGADVTVGDRITSINNGVDIQASGNINVDGIKAREKINLTTTGENGAIVLNHTYNDGALNTESTENDAVIIDARGANGSFQNLTSAESAITTGTGGNWKVYSYSPDADEFGTNLNSGTNAQWGATSTSYSASQNDDNKYIFQVQPTVYVTANDMTKVYGEELTNDNVTTTTEATFVGQDENEHNVNEYTNAFNEGNVADYYNGSGTFTSKGWAKTATRTGGDKAPANEPDNKAIYNIKAAPGGYDLTDKGRASGYAGATAKDGGTVKILRRQINVNGSGNQTYGNATINDWTLIATLTGKQEGVTGGAIVNGNQLDNSTDILSIKSGSTYAVNQAGRTTADANENPYTDAVNMEKVGFKNGAGVNYEIVNTQGDLTVNKANLTIHTKGFTATYGSVDVVKAGLKNAGTLTGLINGDETKFASTVDGTSDALVEGGTKTNHVGDYDVDAVIGTDLQGVLNKNYKVKYETGKATITPFQIDDENYTKYITGAAYTTRYGHEDGFGQATFNGFNGDTVALAITDSSALLHGKDGRTTDNVATNAYTTTVSLDRLDEKMKKDYGLTGRDSFTFKETASVTPVDLTIHTKGFTATYGSVDVVKAGLKNAGTLTGLINGDE
ncbi:two-partner secretion domain-containing protein, partial [Mitsuokella jalaludinii]|uniref:two-partner secretion domain-containing protein n=1 Tax=Mitsuokella jalaludinii TaxID=187979 RepID=UPI003F9A14B4